MDVLSQFVEYSVIGIASGGIYILAALGFVVVYKASNVFNFALGEMMMMGAYFFFGVVVQLHFGTLVGLPIALIGSAVLAMLIERFLLRPMLGRPVIVLVMITFGLGSILRGLAAIVWTSDVLTIPDFLPRQPLFIGSILVPGKLAWGFIVAMVISLSFIAYYRFSRAGIALRATSSDLTTAEGLGIDARRAFAQTWAISGALSATAGLILASINGLTPQLGGVVIDIIAVVFLGGISSVGGVVIAGLFIGWLETILGAYLGANWQSFLPFLVVLLVMMFRPRGLFGEKRIERI
ncbi:MAG TPA: branched-chain amino acid ABC transporter permease [Pseudorhodoplanes sp.]|nr:branched-chain amino acid ABC transporter permease [Pseudorhodoplanes sp.]HVZ13771.1 branched-chain amino acid ABC transporter permease [Bauldia sp.]